MSKDYSDKDLKRLAEESDCIIVDGKRTKIKRGSFEHAMIDATHRMREDGSYFKNGGN